MAKTDNEAQSSSAKVVRWCQIACRAWGVSAHRWLSPLRGPADPESTFCASMTQLLSGMSPHYVYRLKTPTGGC
jgi:hypothetical protein